MNQIERRLFEMLQVLAGQRGNEGKRALRVEEFESAFDSVNNRYMQQIGALADASQEQGVSVSNILAELVQINEQADQIVQYVDDEVLSARNALNQALQDARDEIDAVTDGLSSDVSTLIPDQRDIDDRLDQLAESVSTAFENILFNTQRLSDAGIHVDPATGTIKIVAVEGLETQFNQVSIDLNAVEAELSLKASTAYVNQAISELVLDPTQIPLIEDLEFRITDAEILISGANAAIELKADTVAVEGLDARVSSAEIDINALESAISLKVDQADFGPVEARLTDAEIELSAFDGASFRMTLADQRQLYDDVDLSSFATFQDLWASYESREALRHGIAFAETQIYARVEDGLLAEAEQRSILAAIIGDAQASIQSESLARSNGDEALSLQIELVSAKVNDNEALISSETLARVTANDALAALINTLSTRVDDNEALITDESAARANEDSALAGQISRVSAEVSSDSVSLISDRYLAENNAQNWTRTNSQGSLTRPENTLYEVGNDWLFSVQSGQRDGMQTRSDRETWRGVENSDAYRVEVDFTLASGSISGAGVWVEWVNTSGTISRAAIALSDMVVGPIATGKPAKATAIFRRPEAFSGAFSFNRIYLWANRSDTALGDALKVIAFHRFSIFPANADEALVADVAAAVEQESIARATEWESIASLVQGTSASFNGEDANAGIVANSLATLEGNAAATLAFRTKAGTAGAQLELISASDPSGDTSIARIDATNIILNGTVTAPMMNVDSLSAITATLGTFQSAATGERVVIEDDRISVFDDNDVLRVRIGKLN